MLHDHPDGYKLEDVLERVKRLGLSKCKCAYLFASNRQDFGSTVEDFFRSKFQSSSAPTSPKFQNKFDQGELFDLAAVTDWLKEGSGK